tara:strand:+ start:675 stop:1238 length:564 start_codon:yes stop_codon:yes gene_type:complete
MTESEGDFHAQGRFVEPEKVITHFHLREGEIVADYGVGFGYFIPCIVKAVGSEGTVLALDIQKNLLEKVAIDSEKNGWNNVQIHWADIDEEQGIPLQNGEVEVGLLINTLFQLEKKDVALREIFRTLKSGGKLYIIDWTESFGGLGPQVGDVVDSDTAVALAETAGFVLERDFPAGEHHYGLAFRKP